MVGGEVRVYGIGEDAVAGVGYEEEDEDYGDEGGDLA